MVYRRCLKLLKNEEKAMDVSQEVFLKLMQKKDKLPKVKKWANFLMRSATNASLDVMRKKAEKGETLNEWLEELSYIEDKEEKLDALTTLQRVFHGEKVETRLLAVSHYLDGLTWEECAREYNLSVSGVRKRLRVLREKSHRMRSEERAKEFFHE